MATKATPGVFDCYAKAAPDEPIFVLRSTDPLAPILVRMWAAARSGNNYVGELAAAALVEILTSREAAEAFKDDAKFAEAMNCATEMDCWRNSQQLETK